MKKVILALAVAGIFAACDSKKKDENKTEGTGTEQTTTTTGGDTGAGKTPDTGAGKTPDTTGGKTTMENLKSAGENVKGAATDAKAGDMKGAADKGGNAVKDLKAAAGN